MALRKSFTIKVGGALSGDGWIHNTAQEAVASNCYIKVESVNANKQEVTAVVSFAGDRSHRKAEYKFSPDMNGENFIKQAYLHLKTLAEFSGAEDC